MAMAVKQVQTALALVIMPDTLRQVEGSVGMPYPIAEQDFRRRFPGDQRVFDRNAKKTVVGHLLDAKCIYPPLNQVTVAITIVAIIHVVWPIGISFVGRAAEDLDVDGIFF